VLTAFVTAAAPGTVLARTAFAAAPASATLLLRFPFHGLVLVISMVPTSVRSRFESRFQHFIDIVELGHDTAARTKTQVSIENCPEIPQKTSLE
jgi:hypothetical protein